MRKTKGILPKSQLRFRKVKSQSYEWNNNREELLKEIGGLTITSILSLDESKGPVSQPGDQDQWQGKLGDTYIAGDWKELPTNYQALILELFHWELWVDFLGYDNLRVVSDVVKTKREHSSTAEGILERSCQRRQKDA